MERDQLKSAIMDSIRNNGFALSGGESYQEIKNKKWRECQFTNVELNAMEQAARRGWFYDYGCYIPIWRNYVEEREGLFEKRYFPSDKSEATEERGSPFVSATEKQRLAILTEIVRREWDSLHVPNGGKKILCAWFVENLHLSQATFNKRWQELRDSKLVDTEGNPYKNA